MMILTHAAMFGWIPFVFFVFVLIPQRHRAVIFCFLAGWLFLPMYVYDVPGLPDWDKVSAVSITVLMAVLATDANRVLMFRPRWYDIGAAGWCVLPFFTSISNGLGPYEGMSAMLSHIALWGIPYFIGRLYFDNRRSLMDLGSGMLIAALVYVPLCIFEMRMSPSLHLWIYGFIPRANWEGSGIFGPLYWKPVVFMDTAFSACMFLGMSSLLAFWFWRTGLRRRLLGMPMGAIFAGLLLVTIMCKVWSGIILTFGGLGVLILLWYWPMRAFLIALLIAAPLYMTVRATGSWSGEAVVSLISQVSERRAASLQTRFDHEVPLIDKALDRPVLGWGRFGRSRILDAQGRDKSLTDGMWVIALGQWGVLGLVSFTAMFLVPLALFIRRYPPWAMRGAVAVAAPFAVMLGLHMADNLLNAFPNPVFTMIAGGIAGLPALQYLAATRRRSAGRGSSAAAQRGSASPGFRQPGAGTATAARVHLPRS